MTLPQPGDVFAERFQLRATLGEGGFAIVYRAHDLIDHRDVALKLILPDADGYSSQRMARFEREVQALRRLQSPHTVRLFHHGFAQGVLFLAFELVPGADLSAHAGAPMQPVLVRHILLQLLDSLGEAHSQGILHRDIKPANIRLFERAEDRHCVKLLDFGIARPLHAAGPKVTKTGHMVGTQRFASPEQLFGEQLTPASDLYSLGVVAYLLLTGTVPDHMRAHTLNQAIRLPPGAADEPLQHVVERLLSLQARDRFQSAEQVIQALSGASPTTPAQPPRPEPPATTATESRRPAATLLGALLLTALVAAAVVWVLGRDRATAPVPGTRENPLELPAAPDLPTVEVAHTTPLEADAAPSPDASAELPRGCGIEPLVRGTLSRRVNGSDYRLVVPDSYDPMKQYALLILLHDVAELPDNVLHYTGFDTDAHRREYFVIAPLGSFVDPWHGESYRYLAAVEATLDQFCIDRERTYAVGLGAGGRGVERYPCVFPVRAFANSGHRNTYEDTRECGATSPTPSIHFSHRKDRYNPLTGGAGAEVCFGEAKQSLAEKEQVWRELNGCDGEVETYLKDRANVCSTWSCDVPFVSCLLDGGRRWPLAGKRLVDVQDCDGPPPDFDYIDAIWKFFADQTPEGIEPKPLPAATP